VSHSLRDLEPAERLREAREPDLDLLHADGAPRREIAADAEPRAEHADCPGEHARQEQAATVIERNDVQAREDARADADHLGAERQEEQQHDEPHPHVRDTRDHAGDGPRQDARGEHPERQEDRPEQEDDPARSLPGLEAGRAYEAREQVVVNAADDCDDDREEEGERRPGSHRHREGKG